MLEFFEENKLKQVDNRPFSQCKFMSIAVYFETQSCKNGNFLPRAAPALFGQWVQLTRLQPPPPNKAPPPPPIV